MGQEQSNMSSHQGLRPGVYRIISATAGTAISISSYGYDKIEAWECRDDESQKWLVQRSGDGYTFQNRKHNEYYIAIGSTDIQSQVYASKFPTTWELLEQGDYYFINKPRNDRVLDLHWGEATNGNKIHIRPPDGHLCKHWKFEHLEDDTKRAISEESAKSLPHDKQELMEKANRAEILEKELTEIKGELAGKNQTIAQHESTIRELKTDLEGRETNKLQAGLSQQQTEVATLQAKTDRLEYLLNQMRGTVDRSPSESR